jgi:hypothetical protein
MHVECALQKFFLVLREAAILLKIEANAAHILIAAPDELLFTLASALIDDAGGGNRGKDKHRRGEEHGKQKRVTGLRP